MTGHFLVQIHPSTIFLFLTTHRALVCPPHEHCNFSLTDCASSTRSSRGPRKIEQRTVRCSTLQYGPAGTVRSSTPGSAEESSSGQCAAAHYSTVQPGRRGAQGPRDTRAAGELHARITQRALILDRHNLSLECACRPRFRQDGAGQHAEDRGSIDQRTVRCSTLQHGHVLPANSL